MPAVQTQQLATQADLIAHGPPQAALAPVMGQADAKLRSASGTVLAAYAKRMQLPLVQWGDFTIELVVAIATYRMLFSRGFNPDSQIDKTIIANYDRAILTLDEIADITNKNARQDPDAIDSSAGYDEMSSLAHSEGGCGDEADAWTHRGGIRRLGRGACSPCNGIGGGGCA